MHQLHLAFDQDEGLRAAVLSLSEQIRGNPLKHAIVLDLNPFWLRAYRLDEAGLNLDWGWLYDPPRYAFTLPALFGGPVDLSRRFAAADKISGYVFGKRSRPGPYLLRIFARPIRDPREQESRQALVRAARAAEIATIVETDEPPSLVAAPGDPVVGTGASGTLGGFLSDGPGGAVYGVTCGHVVAGGSVSSGGTVLGPVTHAHPPLPLPPSVMCTAGCSSMSRVDVALFGVGSAVSNVATSIANLVGRSDIVEMHGATTGKMTYEIGGAVVELELGGSCWDRLFLIHAPTMGVLPLGISVTTHPVPKPGDSGAWILRNTNEWAGMVMARSALHGYAVPATIVIGESDALFGTSLQLV